MEKILEVNNVTVKYKKIVAVDDVTFSISDGEIFGIIGPNGAGKTSLVEAIEGLRKIDSGNISLLAKSVVAFAFSFCPLCPKFFRISNKIFIY